MKKTLKILVIRLSSMGDIIYTTPVVRCLKLQLVDAEIHFLTKPAFKYIYEGNPYVDKLLLLQKNLSDTIYQIKAEKYDYLIDLHNNLRTSLIKFKTGIPASTFKKQPLQKWLYLKWKWKFISDKHLVDRYLETVAFLGIKNDGQPINYYLKRQYKLPDLLPASHLPNYVVFIIGATHFTKRMPNEKVAQICNDINFPVVLLGGDDVKINGDEIASFTGKKIYNACGTLTLDQSVFLLTQAHKIIGFDTGLTHIAEAFDKPVASVWGSTAPELVGVWPYQKKDAEVIGVDLYCRPCSKFGLEKCPLGHFKCMKDIPNQQLINFANKADASF
ncbi:glycosyl transferase [Mucilaginibacter sp. HMF7410]|uniref:Glycosyl transferase n=1 Tax=Mucilaginibacter arboris TaxID=2682090 RepID=A0A7K1SYF4_9SPHI|nr:glycosyl transferase [Mucilaginibacter arboris]